MLSKVYRYILPGLFVVVVLLAACASGLTNPTPTVALPPGAATVGPTPAAASTQVGIPATGGSGQAAGPTTIAPTPLPPLAGPGNFASAIRDVVERVRPAIVQITNEQVQAGQFNQPFTIPAGVGSGVIYDAQGYILTNNHVVAGAQRLLVSLPDGRSFHARLIGADPQTDLAVVQISGNNLPVATLGDSTALQVGDWVVAIGNALALPGGPTVSNGVVSALGRSVQEPADQNGNPGPFLFDLVQTDAPINPGNSGGALVNLTGQVIGINTLVAGQAEPGVQAQGIGFAISISTAKPIADELVSTGHATHSFLGIQYEPLNPGIAAQLGIQQTEGALVGDVVSGSPAEQAGLQADDVISAVDNQPLKQESDLAKFLSTHKPGDVVTLTAVRGNQAFNVKVTLGTMPASGG